MSSRGGFLEGLLVGAILGGLSILVAAPTSRKELSTKVKNLKYSNPKTIKLGSKVSLALNIMKSNKISVLPVVDDFGLILGSIKLSQCI